MLLAYYNEMHSLGAFLAIMLFVPGSVIGAYI